ncbi:MAG: methyltransferase domain-containing protein [bacterium]|nr:methyltransferase domain-containing protein [bacterium]
MRTDNLWRRVPRFLHRHVLHWEATIEDAVSEFAASLPGDCRVLDAGAGEGQHTSSFARHRYVGVDLAVGDDSWDYSKLDCIATLSSLPFPDSSFDACLNVVTLEHVAEPAKVLSEISRILAPGGRFLIIVPHAWEVHQIPHDYFRYTRYGIRYLLEGAGFSAVHVYPMGGYFRLLARRLLNGLQFFHGIWFFLAAMVLCPPALVLPFFDRLDRDRNFTLGYVCTARRQS